MKTEDSAKMNFVVQNMCCHVFDEIAIHTSLCHVWKGRGLLYHQLNHEKGCLHYKWWNVDILIKLTLYCGIVDYLPLSNNAESNIQDMLKLYAICITLRVLWVLWMNLVQMVSFIFYIFYYICTRQKFRKHPKQFNELFLLRFNNTKVMFLENEMMNVHVIACRHTH